MKLTQTTRAISLAGLTMLTGCGERIAKIVTASDLNNPSTLAVGQVVSFTADLEPKGQVLSQVGHAYTMTVARNVYDIKVSDSKSSEATFSWSFIDTIPKGSYTFTATYIGNEKRSDNLIKPAIANLQIIAKIEPAAK